MAQSGTMTFEELMAHAAGLADEGRIAEAAATYLQAAAEHPDQPGPHYELGLLHHRQGQLAEAIACFERAAAMMPQDASIWNNLGVSHLRQGDHDKAESCFRQAVALDPNYADAWYGLGRASQQAGRRGDARVAYRACLRALPEHTKAPAALADLSNEAAQPRVGIVTLWYERGQAYVSKMLRDALATTHETYVLARNGGTAERQLLSTSGEWAIPNVTPYPEYTLPRDLLRRWIEEHGLRLVLFNEEYDFGLVEEARRAGARTVGIYYWELFDPAWAATVNEIYDVVICPTECTFARFRSLGIDKAVRLPWGVDERVFHPADRRPSDTVRFFHPSGWGGLHARRGTQAVIDAFLAAGLPNAELLVHTQHGQGVERQGKVTIRHGTVPRDELVRMYQGSDVAVLPSKWEGLGLTFLEAMGCGLPVIAVDAPPMNEFVVPGETGLLCPVAESKRYEGIFVEGVATTTEDLAGAMARLADRDLLAAMRAATLRRAPEYAWSHRYAAVLDVVARAMAASTPASEPPGGSVPRAGLRLPCKDYAGRRLVTEGQRRLVEGSGGRESATVHLVGARRSNYPWGMENEIYRALELDGYRVLDTDFRQEFTALPEKLRQQAHLTLVVKGNGIPPELIRAQACPTVLWYPDDIFLAEHARPQLAYNGAAFDRVYTFDPCAVEEYRRLGMNDVRWLPLAASPAVHRRLFLPKLYDVSFVGNIYPNRQRLLERLQLKFNLHVARAFHDDMVRVLNQSKITLNLGIGPTGIQLRVFEALGSGCFLLTNEIPPESRLFTDREHLVYFRDEDIEDLIGYYLAHEEEREEIALNGYREVHAKHTFAHRVATIMADTFTGAAVEASAEHVAPGAPAIRVGAPRAASTPGAPALPSTHDDRLNVAAFVPSWNGEVDELAMVHLRALRARGHTVTLNEVGPECRAVLGYGDQCASAALAAAEAHHLPLYSYVLDIPTWRLDAPEHREHYAGYREVLQRSTEILALSEQTRAAVRQFTGRDARVCYLGLPMTELDLSQPEFRIDEAFQIAFLSRLVAHKHPEVIIEALSLLARRPRLVIMAKSGDRTLMEDCQALGKRLGVEIAIKIGLTTSDVAKELHRSMLLVSASTFEGFGMSPGEALYCQRPAIVTDLPAFREAYKDYVHYFPEMDARALAGQLEHLLSNGPLRRWMGEQGQEYVARHYTVAQGAQRLESLLRAMDSRPVTPAATRMTVSPAGAKADADRVARLVESHAAHLAEFYGLSDSQVEARLQLGEEPLDTLWRENRPSGAAIAAFYETAKDYPFALAAFTDSRRLTYLVEIINEHVSGKARFLDYGAGIGDVGLYYADEHEVALLDVPGTTQAFARYRAERLGLTARFVNAIDAAETYDVISAQDVLEHLSEPYDAVQQMAQSLRPGGTLLTSGFWFNPSVPLHLAENARYTDRFVTDWQTFGLWLVRLYQGSNFAIGAFRKSQPMGNGSRIATLRLRPTPGAEINPFITAVHDVEYEMSDGTTRSGADLFG